ncbi:hypothetical protein [Nocardioides flavescens]|uniref:Uncharacterized protein n=1 Tax=Nocardioides flavescens TaxID=2691959 RepID=A0A6L7EXQ1_9ACTN|nr:hypothetical protein [Nocardioides flavescens]MXG88879.1 hypothetical protein [Nocardioides flavescens]
MDGRRLGSLIGCAGGLAFVLVSAGGVPGAWWWRALGLVLAGAVLVAIVVSRAPAPPPPDRRALRIYGACVLAMVLAILVGARVLNALGETDLVRLWVVLVVGIHFVPFASAFRQPLFTRLGATMAAIAVAAGAISPWVSWAPYAGAVGGGLALLVFALLGLVRPDV